MCRRCWLDAPPIVDVDVADYAFDENIALSVILFYDKKSRNTEGSYQIFSVANYVSKHWHAHVNR